MSTLIRYSLRRYRVATLILALFVLSASQAAAAGLRTWKDKSGKHEIEATFEKIEDGKVHLKRADGTSVKIPLKLLSKEDQKHLREAAKAKSGDGSYSGGSSQSNRRNNSRSFNYSERTVNGNTTTESRFSYQEGGVDEEPKRRTWKDATGKHKIEGTFMSLEDGKVRLRRTDNKVISIELKKLSRADQDEAKRLAGGFAANRSDADNPFGDEAIDPEYSSEAPKREPGEYLQGDIVEAEEFGDLKRGTVVSGDGHWIKVLFDGEDSVSSVSRRGDRLRMIKANPNAVARSASGLVLTKADYSSVEQVLLGTSNLDGFLPNPLANNDSQPRLRSIRLGGSRNFFENPSSFAVSSNGRFAMISYEGSGGMRSNKGRIQVCDLSTGKVREYNDLQAGFKLAKISPSGMRIAAMSEPKRGSSGFGNKTIDIYELSGGELQHLLSWKPFKGEFRADIRDIAWLGDDRVATVGSKSLTVWEVQGARAMYTLTLNGISCGAISPGLQQMAISDSTAIHVLDVATGRPIQQVEIPQGRRHQALAFDPSGKLLAGLDSGQLDLMNLETGEVFDTLFVPDSGSTLSWTDGEHLLVGGKKLVHVPSQMTIWQYQHSARKTANAAGVNWYLLASNDSASLLPLRLPHPAVKPISDSDVILNPGDAVSLELEMVSNLGQGSIREETKKRLTAYLEQAGYVVSNDAAAVLVARTEPGESRQVVYEDFGIRRGRGESISVTSQIYTLELQIDGKTVWTRKQIKGPPHFIQLQRGESTRQAVARLMKPSAVNFGRGIPGRILPLDKMAERTSSISASGIR